MPKQCLKRFSDTFLNSMRLQVMAVLSGIDAWTFDSFKLDEVTGHRPLSTLGFALMKREGIIDCLGLNEMKLARQVSSLAILASASAYRHLVIGTPQSFLSCTFLSFLICIEDGYRNNPYHSRSAHMQCVPE